MAIADMKARWAWVARSHLDWKRTCPTQVRADSMPIWAS